MKTQYEFNAENGDKSTPGIAYTSNVSWKSSSDMHYTFSSQTTCEGRLNDFTQCLPANERRLEVGVWQQASLTRIRDLVAE